MKNSRQIFAYFFVFILIISSQSLTAQDYVTKENASKKALKAYAKGDMYNRYKDYENAIEALTDALKAEPTFADALLLRGDSYYAKEEFANAEADFEQLLTIAPAFNLRIYFVLGIIEQRQGKYEEAATHFQDYLDTDPKSSQLVNKAKVLLQNAQFASEAVRYPVPFDPQNLGENINSEFPEYLPAMTADGKTFIFTRRLGYQEDFFESHLQADGTWSPAENLGPPINTMENEGAESISADGSYLVYTVCNRKEDYGSCDLYFSVLINEKWSKPKNIGGELNTSAWEAQPSLSADGKTLFFASNRNNGKGGKDIWVTNRQADGSFSAPENLNINTNGNEECPFIHPDGETLYFTSTGYPGMGGADLYMSKKQEDGTWGEPKNLGYPINTENNEGSLMLGLDGKIAYFASDKAGGYGAIDLYSFEMPEHLRPKPVTYVKGVVLHAETKRKIKATVNIFDLEKESLIQSVELNGKDDFLICLPVGVDYRLSVEKEGFLFHSENFALKADNSIEEPYLLDIYLQPIPPKPTAANPTPTTTNTKPVVLKNVFFETGSATLQPASKAELNVLVRLLTENTELKIQINGHTDNVGAAADNLTLSQNRAQAVVDFLIQNGIAQQRLRSKGFGETKPISPNDSPAGRQQNRRTEFEVL